MRMEVAKNIALIATNTFLLLVVLFLRVCMSLYALSLSLTHSYFLYRPSSKESSISFFVLYMPVVFNLIFLSLIKDYVCLPSTPHP